MSCNISILTEDQRRRIEKNRLDALNRKNAMMMAQQELNDLKIESAVKPVLKEEITNEQRARMEKNRQLALERKRSKMKGKMNTSDTKASTQYGDAGINIITPSTKRQKVKQDDAEKKCKHCYCALSTHDSYFGNDILMCKLIGRYGCDCGHWWWGDAYKLTQHHNDADDSSRASSFIPTPDNLALFPKYTFPDCKNCNTNDKVNLWAYEVIHSRSSKMGRGHQSELCQLCKKGWYCPQA
jgi:hypothetical protein